MARLEKPRGLNIVFKPSERQYELWNALQPNHCDKCGGTLEMRPNGYDKNGHQIFEATCVKCGNTDIPEQLLGGGSARWRKIVPWLLLAGNKLYAIRRNQNGSCS